MQVVYLCYSVPFLQLGLVAFMQGRGRLPGLPLFIFQFEQGSFSPFPPPKERHEHLTNHDLLGGIEDHGHLDEGAGHVV